MDTHTPYSLAVTYLDSNYVWKDIAVDQRDGAARSARTAEGESISIASTFWENIPRSAHIRHITVTAHGRTLFLSWPPPGVNLLATPGSLGSPELILRLRLRFGRDETPTSVEWDTGDDPKPKAAKEVVAPPP